MAISSEDIFQISLASGAVPRGGLVRNSPPTPHKGHFCKLSKTDEKKLGVWGVTSPVKIQQFRLLKNK